MEKILRMSENWTSSNFYKILKKKIMENKIIFTVSALLSVFIILDLFLVFNFISILKVI